MSFSRRPLAGRHIGRRACAARRLRASAGELVGFVGYRPGTIVIVTHRRELYFVLGRNRAIRYPVGVGKAGMAWHGRAHIALKELRPAWSPPEDIGGAILPFRQ